MRRKQGMEGEELWNWFLTQLEINNNSCWEWKGAVGNSGYGLVNIKKKTGAHVYALERKLGRPLHKGLVTRHLCNNRLCCNPEHLEEGTYKENMIDRELSGNTRRGDTHVNVKGELHPQSKLNNKEVFIIRSLKGIVKSKELSEIYSIDRSHVSDIQNYKTWKHI